MSSRQEQKEQRKREREERERAAAQAARRKRLLQIVGGVVVGAVVVVGIVLALAGGGDSTADAAEVKALSKEAGCVARDFPEQGRDHVAKKLTAADYKTNPPTSGPHVPPGQEAQPGVYATGNEPNIGNWVHTLEHGRILFQYKPGTPAGRIATLQTLFDEDVRDSGNGYHSVLMQNNSKMPFEVAAVAWQAYVGCPKFNDKTIAALRAFREVYVDTAPEQVP